MDEKLIFYTIFFLFIPKPRVSIPQLETLNTTIVGRACFCRLFYKVRRKDKKNKITTERCFSTTIDIFMRSHYHVIKLTDIMKPCCFISLHRVLYETIYGNKQNGEYQPLKYIETLRNDLYKYNLTKIYRCALIGFRDTKVMKDDDD